MFLGAFSLRERFQVNFTYVIVNKLSISFGRSNFSRNILLPEIIDVTYIFLQSFHLNDFPL